MLLYELTGSKDGFSSPPPFLERRAQTLFTLYRAPRSTGSDLGTYGIPS